MKECTHCGAKTLKEKDIWCNGLYGKSVTDDLPTPKPSHFIIDYKKLFKFKKESENDKKS